MDLLSEVNHITDAPRLSAETVEKLLAATDTPLDQLMVALVPAAQKYSTPLVSGYRVGAVALGKSGSLYYGGNVEFVDSALSYTVHAEQAAVVHAAMHAEPAVMKLAVSAPPCGYCRQFLNELVQADHLQILLADSPPTRLTDYLPHAFGPANLGIAGGLLVPQRGMLEWVKSPSRFADACELLLQTVSLSYAPYTGALGAVGLVTHDGKTFAGPYLENAAFNPSVSPIQAAAVSLVLANRNWNDVRTALCVQTVDSAIDHASVARHVMSKAAPHVEMEQVLIRASLAH